MSRIGEEKEVTLFELLDRMIDRGVVLTGDLTISVADVDLVSVALNVVLASVQRMSELEAGP
ncbi:MAG: gas vesicle protein [Kofleriaceae bacterium]